MRDETLALLDEFAAAWARGETPDPRELLARAPAEEQAELAQALDRYLAASPPRQPSEAARAYVAAIAAEAEATAEPPLLALRLQRRLTRDAVVDRLMGALKLDPGRREKVRAYFADLEVGVLDPRGVQQAVWEALGQVFGKEAVARLLLKPGGVSLSAEAAFYRLANRPQLEQQALPAVAPSLACRAGRGRPCCSPVLRGGDGADLLGVHVDPLVLEPQLEALDVGRGVSDVLEVRLLGLVVRVPLAQEVLERSSSTYSNHPWSSH